MAPPITVVGQTEPRTRRTRQGELVEWVARPRQEIVQEYRATITAFASALAHNAFATVPGLDGLAISLFSPAIHPTLGHHYLKCMLAVLIDRTVWTSIIHTNVTAENALRNFPFRFRPQKDGEFRDEAPFLPPTALSAQALAVGPGGSGLNDMDPLKFEELVRQLLLNMGYVAELTKASHDGGIDIVANNPQPVVGGRVIVQCKRYRDTIGSPTVRDLYGVVMSERANKGILVTTSDFSPDARAFAQDKPLELVNGQELVALLSTHGLVSSVGPQSLHE